MTDDPRPADDTLMIAGGIRFRYDYAPGAVDETLPLIYLWEVLDPEGTQTFAYVGKAIGGAKRPRTAYRMNVNRLLSGKPYRRSKPDGFRQVHRRLADAAIHGDSIRLTLLENAPVHTILARERHWQREYGSDATDGHEGDSVEQRIAETLALRQASIELGVELAPTHLDGMNFDGIATDPPTLVEVWAHIGPPKPAQKHKVTADALKLVWGDSRYFEGRARKVIVTLDADAAAPFVDGTWMARAFRDLGVEVMTVRMPGDVLEGVRAAQRRQARGNR